MIFPRMVISALRGGSGKTILTIGIIAALLDQNKSVSPFKKGPDYIDAGWLTLAGSRPCYNLDTFLVDRKQVLQSFLNHISPNDIAVIEGNRGLYDGIDIQGSTSTSELAKLLDAPVILCIDCTKSTRTMAAAVLGCVHFDPDVNIAGIILNRVAGSRHENILRSSIEHHSGIPVIGAVPKLGKQNFPERHMGLVPTPEHAWAMKSIDSALEMAKQYLDIKRIIHIATDVPALKKKEDVSQYPVPEIGIEQVKIGVIKDSAFQFYYPENIEALVAAGADIVFISPLQDNRIPMVDGIYIGGGFPETHARELAEHIQFRDELKGMADEGLPIYAECGGLMYLGEELVLDGTSYPMTGVLPVVFGFSKKPQGHGYTVVSVDKENPFFNIGTELKGHEFHYSRVLEWRGEDENLVFKMKRGAGFMKMRDGVCFKNVLATYTHIHALGTPGWAQAMVRRAADHRGQKKIVKD